MGKTMRIFPEGAFMSRDYYIHKRQNGIYYVEFIDKASGKKLSARSTGETDPVKAQVKAELWKTSGIPTGRLKKPRPVEEAAGIEAVIRVISKSELNADDALRIVSKLKSMGLIDIAAVKNTGRGAEPFVPFLENFWYFDKSEYIQDKLAHGYRFTRRHAHECLKRVKSDLKPFFGDKKINCVTKDDLNTLSNRLAEKGLATGTINQILLICQTPLRWCYKQGIIPVDPSAGLTKFSIKNKKRGVLTVEEARALFYTHKELWAGNKHGFAASLLSATCGARQGECLAIRLSDIGEKTINISHSYSNLDGLKCPKNSHERFVPLLPFVRDTLLDLLKDNPHKVDDPFVFYSSSPDRPVDGQVLLSGLQKALGKLGIDYKGRNISFHSWRHFFCSQSTQKISGEKVAKVSGHISEAVFKKYADHIEAENVREVGDAISAVFENIIPFPVKKAV
jgi:integrase